MKRTLHVIAVCILAFPVWAAENIVLRTGSQLPADRHEVEGAIIRIYSGDGFTEIPMSLVARVEPAEPAPPASAAPANKQPASAEPAASGKPGPADSTPADLTEATMKSELPPASAALKPGALAPADLTSTVLAETTAKSEPAPPADLTPAGLAETAARKYALPDAFVAGVMRAESNFNAAAISPKGAIGLMQLMPDTARDLGADPNRPAENADAGARYLRDLLARYQDNPDQVVLALAAYNAGPAAVEKYHGVPPFRETREYILRVLKAWNPPIAGK